MHKIHKIQHKNIMFLTHCIVCLQFKVLPLGVPLMQSVLSHIHMTAESRQTDVTFTHPDL